jgi:hypothetical protein
MPVEAAVYLDIALFSDISPPEETFRTVDLVKGESKTVRITVGKKP